VHFAVRWSRSLRGAVVGVARTAWPSGTGLQVAAIDLATRDPYAPDRVIDPDRIRLTAAHEMGHAPGLPHSDSDRDVMYPTNGAASRTARDYRSMEALYAVPDGRVLAR
jgi:predicted Zn-dependent protease